MGINYRNIKPVGQYDATTCWAASLEWYLKAVSITGWSQIRIIEEFEHLYSGQSDGTISNQGLVTLIKDNRWGMIHQELPSGSYLSPEVMFAFLRSGPVYIGYWDQKVGGKHVNVIYEMKDGGNDPRVKVMEPRYKESKDYSYKGKHLTRNLSYYKSNSIVYMASPDTRGA